MKFGALCQGVIPRQQRQLVFDVDKVAVWVRLLSVHIRHVVQDTQNV